MVHLSTHLSFNLALPHQAEQLPFFLEARFINLENYRSTGLEE